jgi:hypothetical protein
MVALVAFRFILRMLGAQLEEDGWKADQPRCPSVLELELPRWPVLGRRQVLRLWRMTMVISPRVRLRRVEVS